MAQTLFELGALSGAAVTLGLVGLVAATAAYLQARADLWRIRVRFGR